MLRHAQKKHTNTHTHSRAHQAPTPLYLVAAQDIEFTVQEGKLFMLQCRGGKRTGQAAFKIAVDLVDEGVISEEDAMLMVRVCEVTFVHASWCSKRHDLNTSKAQLLVQRGRGGWNAQATEPCSC